MMDQVPFAYSIRATRAVDSESPSTIGERLVRTLDALTRSNPSIFTNWEITDRLSKAFVPLTAARSCIGTIVEDNVARDDWGEPDLFHGYSLMAHTGGVAAPRRITLWIIAGGKSPGHVWFQTGFWRVAVDPSIVNFLIFNTALQALVANWSLPWISAHAFRSNYSMVPVHGGAGYKLESRPMLPQEPTFPRSPFEIPWIGYLSTDLAARVKLTSEIETERTADGGLLMIATKDRLDPDNSEHLRRARIIAETMITCTGWMSGGNDRR
jgi:Immunity protein 52